MRPLIVDRLMDGGMGWLAGLVPTDAVLYVALFITLSLLFVRRSGSAGLPADRALEVVCAAAIGAMVGQRLYFLIVSGEILRVPISAWPDLSLGTASWGAYTGSIAGIVAYAALVAKASPWPQLDAAASCAGLGDVIGRWACLMAGDDFGRITSAPWAIRFPEGSFAHRAHVASGLLEPGAPLSLPVHPFQLYMFLNGLVVFAIVTGIWRRHRWRPGRTLAGFLVVYGSTRFWWEFFRHPDPGATGALSASQWACVAIVAGGLMLLAVCRRMPLEEPAPLAGAG